MSRLLRLWRAAPKRAVLLAILGMVSLGVMSMHLLSSDHQLASLESHHQHGHSGEAGGQPLASQIVGNEFSDPHSHGGLVNDQADPAQHRTVGARVAGIVAAELAHLHPSGDVCEGGCGHHEMMFGSCILALSLCMLRLVLGRPRLQVWCPRTPVRVNLQSRRAGLAVRRLALTHRELSICRT